MPELQKSKPHKTAKDARKAKLEAALKENLRRRKAQARARKGRIRADGMEPTEKGPLSGPDLTKR